MRWRRDRVAEMAGKEGDHLAVHLQFRDVAIEVDPVEALEVQRNMTLDVVVG
jgi:hypothetical protein